MGVGTLIDWAPACTYECWRNSKQWRPGEEFVEESGGTKNGFARASMMA